MADFNLITMNGDYNNTDVFERTLSYILRLDTPYKYFLGVYPITLDGAIASFSRTYNLNQRRSSDQKVWHMVLSADCHDCRSRNSHRSCSRCRKINDLFHFSHYFAELLSFMITKKAYISISLSAQPAINFVEFLYLWKY